MFVILIRCIPYTTSWSIIKHRIDILFKTIWCRMMRWIRNYSLIQSAWSVIFTTLWKIIIINIVCLCCFCEDYKWDNKKKLKKYINLQVKVSLYFYFILLSSYSSSSHLWRFIIFFVFFLLLQFFVFFALRVLVFMNSQNHSIVKKGSKFFKVLSQIFS